MKTLFTLAILLLQLSYSTETYAQGGGIGNGGDLNEIALLNRFDRITGFLGTDEGRAAFPKLVQADFIKLKSQLVISIVDGVLKDKLGQTRSELNFWDIDPEKRKTAYIQFSREAIKNFEGNEAELYVILFHSMLNLLGLELSDTVWSANVKPSSIYPISSLIAQKVPTLNAQAILVNRFHIACRVLDWEGKTLRINNFLFDPYLRKVALLHNEFFFPDLDLKHHLLGDDQEVMSRRRLQIRPVLAQSVEGNLLKLAFSDFKTKQLVKQAYIMLPTRLKSGEKSFIEIRSTFHFIKDYEDKSEMLQEVELQSTPDNVPEPILSCILQKGALDPERLAKYGTSSDD